MKETKFRNLKHLELNPTFCAQFGCTVIHISAIGHILRYAYDEIGVKTPDLLSTPHAFGTGFGNYMS